MKIAETTFLMTTPKGETKDIKIEIEQPYDFTESEAICPIKINGLYKKTIEIHGVDTFQALALAFEFIRNTIISWENKGYSFQFEQGEKLPKEIWFMERKIN
jgi:Domain of unknown function (DUF6968)